MDCGLHLRYHIESDEFENGSITMHCSKPDKFDITATDKTGTR